MACMRGGARAGGRAGADRVEVRPTKDRRAPRLPRPLGRRRFASPRGAQRRACRGPDPRRDLGAPLSGRDAGGAGEGWQAQAPVGPVVGTRDRARATGTATAAAPTTTTTTTETTVHARVRNPEASLPAGSSPRPRPPRRPLLWRARSPLPTAAAAPEPWARLTEVGPPLNPPHRKRESRVEGGDRWWFGPSVTRPRPCAAHYPSSSGPGSRTRVLNP